MKNRACFLRLSFCCALHFTGAMLFLSVSSASAAEFYMAPGGSDITGNGSIGNPWATLGTAQGGMSAGDTLYVRGGTYTNQHRVLWTLTGTQSNPITIQAYPGEKPFIDGSAIREQLFHIEEADWLTIDGLTVRGYKNVIWMGREDINSAGRATNNVIRNNYFYDSTSHLIYSSWGNEDVAIYNNTFEHPGGHPLGEIFRATGSFFAIQFWHGPGVQGAEVYNNLFLDAYFVDPDPNDGSNNGRGGAMSFGDGARDVNIHNNTFYGNANGLTILSGGGEGPDRGVIDLTVRNNIFHIPESKLSNSLPPGFGGIRVSTSTPASLNEITADHNVWHRADGNDFMQWGSAKLNLQEFQATGDSHGIGSTEADPKFAVPGLTGAGDFHLQSGSPAIDTGVATGAPATDIDGNSRPQGAGFDIGAYELLVAPVENADFDGSGFVDGSDFLAWQRGFGKSDPVLSDGDANEDGNVDAIDLAIWEGQFGNVAAAAAAVVPEPTAGLLLAAGLGLLVVTPARSCLTLQMFVVRSNRTSGLFYR